MSMDRMKKKSVPWLCFAIIALMVFPLAGCGGGGDGWEEVQVQSQPPVNQPPRPDDFSGKYRVFYPDHWPNCKSKFLTGAVQPLE
jgi:hypothetical protein